MQRYVRCPVVGVLLATVSTVAYGAAEPTAAVRVDSGTVSTVDATWLDELSLEVRSQMQEHLRVKGSIRSKPEMTNTVLGVSYEATRGLPLAVFDHVLKTGVGERRRVMFEAFNVQVLSPEHPVTLPFGATLRSTLSLHDHSQVLETEMELGDSNAYYVADVDSYVRDVVDAVRELHAATRRPGIPIWDVEAVTGLVFDQETVQDLPPLGAAVTYNIRFGDVRVQTGFQWVGRPKAIPFNDGVEFLQ